MDLFFLRFRDGLHLSRGVADLGSVDPFPRSDTWIAALLSVWPRVDPAADLAAFAAAPPFRVSSALPARRGRQGVEWFLPAPLGLFARGARDARRRKRAKSIQFLAPEAVARALRGEPPPSDARALLQGGAIWPAHEPEPGQERQLFTTERSIRVGVDRLSARAAEGGHFAFARTRFAPDAGAALLVETDAALRKTFRRLLVALGEEGIGGERSVGLGAFDVDGPLEVRLPDIGRGGRLLLSLTAPSREAVEQGLLDPPSRYRLVERGGWVTQPAAGGLRRRTLRMLGEGSLVRPTAAEPGRAVRVLEPMPAVGLAHAIYRGGPALALEMAAEWSA